MGSDEVWMAAASCLLPVFYMLALQGPLQMRDRDTGGGFQSTVRPPLHQNAAGRIAGRSIGRRGTACLCRRPCRLLAAFIMSGSQKKCLLLAAAATLGSLLASRSTEKSQRIATQNSAGGGRGLIVVDRVHVAGRTNVLACICACMHAWASAYPHHAWVRVALNGERYPPFTVHRSPFTVHRSPGDR
eukprot:353978-Chlamydomonas_euryale.AAC.4